MENKNVLVISPEANVVFVGKYEKYVYFKNQLKEYNAEIRKKYNFEEGKNLRIYSEFTSQEELIGNIITRLINMHNNLTNSIEILDKTIKVSEKVCNSQAF